MVDIPYLSRFSPLRAYRDLRLFLSQRQPHQLGFFALAVVMSGLVLAAFIHDSHEVRAYKRDIQYVENWRLDRTDAQIRAQQKIDQAAREEREAALNERKEKLRASFQRLDEQMNGMGL